MAALKVEQEKRDETEDEIDGAMAGEDQAKKGRKLVPTDSLRRYRGKLYKADYD